MSCISQGIVQRLNSGEVSEFIIFYVKFPQDSVYQNLLKVVTFSPSYLTYTKWDVYETQCISDLSTVVSLKDRNDVVLGCLYERRLVNDGRCELFCIRLSFLTNMRHIIVTICIEIMLRNCQANVLVSVRPMKVVKFPLRLIFNLLQKKNLQAS